MWRAIADARAKTHSRDAIAVYHKLLPLAVEQGAYGARYKSAFELVRTIMRLRTRLGEDAQFANELDTLKTTYRAKRNFMKLLATLG